MSSQAMPASTSSSTLSSLSRPGWLTFAAVVMFSVAVLRVISAVYYFADSHRVNDLSLGAFGHHLFLWGLWDLGIALLAFAAGWALLQGNMFGRVLGYIWAGVVIVQSFTIISYAPWYGFAAMILAVLVIYALSATSGWTDRTASP
jgi:hypothetical protein